MTSAIGDYLVAHDRIIPIEVIREHIFDEDDTIYEVIRVIDSKPLFLEEHIERLAASFRARQLDISDEQDKIVRHIHQLIDHNHLKEGNIRFQFNRNNINDFCAWFIPAHYPDKQQYTHGVNVMTYNAARNEPNIKTRDIKLREEANAFIDRHKIYEVILVNEEGYLTEGSRSNIFFIRKNLFVTPPPFRCSARCYTPEGY